MYPFIHRLVFKPLLPPDLLDNFKGLLNLLSCSKMSKLVAVVLMRALKDQNDIISDIMIEQVNLSNVNIQDFTRNQFEGNFLESFVFAIVDVHSVNFFDTY